MAPESPQSSQNRAPIDLSNMKGFLRLSPAQQHMLRVMQEDGRPINCHLAVFYLEKGEVEEGGDNRHQELRRFQLEGYELSQDPTLEALTAQIIGTDFPCIVAPSTIYDPQQPPEPMHTFVAFQAQNGDIILWEKSGFGGGYQTRTLQEVYDAYQSNERPVFWRTRKLTTP